MPWGTRLKPIMLLAAILALIAAAFAPAVPAQAAPDAEVILQFDVVSVKEDESVTIRTKDFPVRTDFQVLIDVVGKKAANGKPAGDFNSEKGGVLEKTFPIPTDLKGQLILAIRVESKDGYLATGWFINENMAYKPAKGSNIKPELAFSNVKKNQSVTVAGKNFAPNFTYSVRIGPYDTFYRSYVFVDSVTADESGNISFDLKLPENSKDAEYIMVRLDGAGQMAYNNFHNVDGGSAVPASQLYKFQWCQVVAIRPVGELHPGDQFDAVWTVQNTSNIQWEVGTVDYKYIGGQSMHKYDSIYDLNWPVWRGAVFDIAVDMIAPSDYAGWHSTTWALVRAGQEMCRLKISVFVTDK